MRLGVNIDHIATIREARGGKEPDPIYAAVLAEIGGCFGITVHLREDRRHIKDRDVRLLREIIKTKLNLEMAATDEITKVALSIKPDQVTLVPEKREELTTEGGLDVIENFDQISHVVSTLQEKKIIVYLFIDPEEEQVKKAKKTGAAGIEIHTGVYSQAILEEDLERELKRVETVVQLANKLKLKINAGHGLNYQNVRPIAQIPFIKELNIGHSIISRASLVGMVQAVKEMVFLTQRKI
ncbi:pyridoxine 5'-phosphate synthase [bacterium]|nr:pyridoxine 5'-phosphate synthase [bacterium]MBU1153582.1 pyridoxine 5'-phosphate synthase [bacterium]MBU2600220.1 pyridoxine 5'-phosphate synthase [bacterium]